MTDLLWIAAAFLLGLGARQIGLPPLVGYLAAGFALQVFGASGGELLSQIADLGVTLLLFTIGLKLRLRTLTRPQVWAVAGIHMAVITVVLAAAVIGALFLGLAFAATTSWQEACLIGFALSYSSTVFAVKFLEQRSDMGTVYGRTMIGILIMQDLAAVVFLALSLGKIPSTWTIIVLVGLWPMRWVLFKILDRVGHGELLILFGFLVALGGAELFEVVQLKGDLGALVLGVLLGGHRATGELAKALLDFKDIFLVGFFLSVGLAGVPGTDAVIVALGLVALLPVKAALFFGLFLAFRMRVRTALLATLGLANYSEFGLIVVALAVDKGWLAPQWLAALAIALALSFVAASPLNTRALEIYSRFGARLRRFQREPLIREEQQIDPGPAAVMVFGMGRVGTGAYDRVVEEGISPVLGLDSAPEIVARQRSEGRHVMRASGTDMDFWARLNLDFGHLKLVLLTMPKVEENLFAVKQLRNRGFVGHIAALAKYEDHAQALEEAGADRVFNLYQEAGAGLAEDAAQALKGA